MRPGDKQAAAFLLAHGANCTLQGLGDMAQFDVIEFAREANLSLDEAQERERASVFVEKFEAISALAQQEKFQKYAQKTNGAEFKVVWSKARYLYLGIRTERSPFSLISHDIFNLIAKKIFSECYI